MATKVIADVLTQPRKFAVRLIAGIVLFFYGLYVLNYASELRAGSDQQLLTILGWVSIVVGGFAALREWKAVSNPRLAFRYALNPVKTIEELIGEWNPGALPLERDYEKSLLEFLRSRLRHVKITRQYGTARVKCDLAVGKDVLLELKTNLTTTHKLQRLLGQIQLYTRELDKPVIVLLLGRTEDDLFKDLQANTGRNVHLVLKEAVVSEDDQA